MLFPFVFKMIEAALFPLNRVLLAVQMDSIVQSPLKFCMRVLLAYCRNVYCATDFFLEEAKRE